MPALVTPDEYPIWLEGEARTTGGIAARYFADPDLYREPTEQSWGTETS
ncbi:MULTISPECIES: hypothetical protein [unclassified Sphingopyxis]|nr:MULTISPECIES: hypothetical protein [unclassified Sphingopyxis]